MVAYIAFIASLNLCVGYVLGVYFGVCPGITPAHDDEVDDNDEVLGLPVAKTVRAAEPVPAAKEVASPENRAATRPPATGPSVATILAGLGEFKTKLEQVSGKLATASDDDRAAIDEFAGEMKQANTEYLERTAVAIQSLDDARSAAPGTTDGLLRQKLNDQSDEVRRVNVEIEGLASEKDAEQVRQKLLASTEQLTQTAAVIEYTLQPEADLPVAESSDALAERGLGSLDSMMALIEQELAQNSDDQPLLVAKLALNSVAELGTGDAGDLLRGIASLVALELTSGQAMFTDPQGQLALTLAGDNEQTASERCERIRQRVACTTFRQGEEERTADLLCSLTDTRKASRSNEVFGRLEAGLAKAADHGTSCTIFHSGDALTVVAPSQLALEPQVVEL